MATAFAREMPAPANGPGVVVAETPIEGPERERWDRFLANAPGGDVVQTSAWAEAKRALGYDVCRVIARAGEAIVGGGQILIRRFGVLGGVGYVTRGPVLAPGWDAQADAVLDALEHAARAHRVRHLIVQPPAGGEAIAEALAARGYVAGAPAVAPTATLRLDVAQSEEAILAGLSPSRRNQLRRSWKRGVQTRLGERDDIELFHVLHAATAQRQGFAPMSRTYLLHQWDALHPGGAAQLVLAGHEGRVLAAIWLTAFGDTVTYRLPGWDGAEPRLYPNVACHWRAITWAREQGYRYYDFGGIERRWAEQLVSGEPLPDAVQRTPAAFKISFGADPLLLPEAMQRTLNPVVRLIVRPAYALARRRSVRRLIDRLRDG